MKTENGGYDICRLIIYLHCSREYQISSSTTTCFSHSLGLDGRKKRVDSPDAAIKHEFLKTRLFHKFSDGRFAHCNCDMWLFTSHPATHLTFHPTTTLHTPPKTTEKRKRWKNTINWHIKGPTTTRRRRNDEMWNERDSKFYEFLFNSPQAWTTQRVFWCRVRFPQWI